MTAQGLIDIQTIRIENRSTVEERSRSFITQIRNPYHYRYGKYEVRIDFTGSERLEDKVVSLLSKN